MNEQISGQTVRECTAEEDLSNTRNTHEKTIKMLLHKVWLNIWLQNTFSTNLIRLLVPLMNPFIPFFNVMGPVRGESWSAIVTTCP